MPPSSIRNVVFDFGGVIVRWAPKEIVDGFYADESLRSLVREAVFQHPDWLEMDRGTLDEQAAEERFAQRTGRSVVEMRALLQRVKESLTPIPESLSILEQLVLRRVALYGLSNMPATTWEYLRGRYDHWQAFRGIVISGEVKMVKPEPQIFEHLASAHRLSASQTVFIDDSRTNIEAAGSLGFRTILFEHPQQCSAQLNRLLDGSQ